MLKLRGNSRGWTLYPRDTHKKSQTKGVPETGGVPIDASATLYTPQIKFQFNNFYRDMKKIRI